LIIALAPIVSMFVVFSVVYVLRLAMPNLDQDGVAVARAWSSLQLPSAILLSNTALLLLSSFTMEMARRRITRKAALSPVLSIPGISLGREPRFPWLAATVVLGLAFIAGQWIAWRSLMSRGFYVATNPSASFVYVLTATHALHLAGGIGVLLYAGIISALKRPVEVRRIFVDVTAWYWHFMALLWLYILAVLEFAG
jgi:cytochrome c oxidase subunit 3